MPLPAPFRAAVGLLAVAADEARHLPDRAIELPMLAVSTALQAALRAQQRYARFTARGDEVLHRCSPTDDPPSGTTFDEPVELDGPRRAAEELTATGDSASPEGGSVNGTPRPGQTYQDIDMAEDSGLAADLGVVEEQSSPEPARASSQPAGTRTSRTTAATGSAPRTPVGKPPAGKSSLATATPARTTVAKSTATKTTATKTTAAKAAATRTSAAERAAGGAEGTADRDSAKTVRKPRHTAPSRFDDVGDE